MAPPRPVRRQRLPFRSAATADSSVQVDAVAVKFSAIGVFEWSFGVDLAMSEGHLVTCRRDSTANGDGFSQPPVVEQARSCRPGLLPPLRAVAADRVGSKALRLRAP